MAIARTLRRKLLPAFLMLISATAAAGSERIVFLGDSHSVGAMGARLHSLLRQAYPGFQVESHGLSGASPSHYYSAQASRRTLRYGYVKRLDGSTRVTNYGTNATAPWIRDLLASGPELIIVEFGDNFANYGGSFPGATINTQLSGLVAEIVRAPRYAPERCFFITPTFGEKRAPYNKTDERLSALIAAIRDALQGRCRIIDSTQLPGFASGLVKTTDGIHLTNAWGNKWADAILEAIR